jgi:hypothetical protein
MTYRKAFFHIRKPSWRGRIAARTSLKQTFRAKVRAPRGWSWPTNPKKAVYNRVYRRRAVALFGVLGRLFTQRRRRRLVRHKRGDLSA